MSLLVHWNHIDEDNQVVRVEGDDQNRTYGLTLCIWKLYLSFEIGND